MPGSSTGIFRVVDVGPLINFAQETGCFLSTETEIKIRINSAADFCSILSPFRPQEIACRHFEDNHLLDFPDKGLIHSLCLLRVRFANGKVILTYKGPPQTDVLFKTREEIETELGNGENALQILERIGFRVWFRYQKYRREFGIGNIIVAVDETPVGNYAEIEGSENDILDLAGKLRVEKSDFIRDSYYGLYLKDCRLKGILPGNMVF